MDNVTALANASKALASQVNTNVAALTNVFEALGNQVTINTNLIDEIGVNVENIADAYQSISDKLEEDRLDRERFHQVSLDFQAWAAAHS